MWGIHFLCTTQVSRARHPLQRGIYGSWFPVKVPFFFDQHSLRSCKVSVFGILDDGATLQTHGELLFVWMISICDCRFKWWSSCSSVLQSRSLGASEVLGVGMFNATTCWNLDDLWAKKWAIPTNLASEKFALNSVNWSAFAAWWKKSNDVGMLWEDEDMRLFVLTFMVDDS